MSATRSLTWPLLVLNLCLYLIEAVLAGWVLNMLLDGLVYSVTEATQATFFLAIFALISAAAGLGSMMMGIHHMYAWSLESFSATAASAGASFILSLEALGLAFKEIRVGLYRHPTLKTLEAFAVMTGVIQTFYVIALQAAKVKGEFS